MTSSIYRLISRSALCVCLLAIQAWATGSDLRSAVDPKAVPQKIVRALGPEWPFEDDPELVTRGRQDDKATQLLKQAAELATAKKFSEALPLLQQAEKLAPKNYEV